MDEPVTVKAPEDSKSQSALTSVPNSVVDRDGHPRFGTYRGELPAVKLDGLDGKHCPEWWHWGLRRKRWHYTIVVTDEVLVCQAVVDGCYFGQSFMYVVDLFEERSVLTRRFLGIPDKQARVNDRPARGHHSSFRAPGVRFQTTRGEGLEPYRWSCSLHPLLQMHPRGLQLEADLDPGKHGPALTVISPVDDAGIVNITQKRTGVPVSGRLRVGSRSYRLDGGLGGLDYTQGILARRTCWRWVNAMGRLSDGRSVGINLVAGFNDGLDGVSENAIWIGDRLVPLDRAIFDYSPSNPDQPWTVRTADGAVELYFTPYYVFSDYHRWKVIHGHFIQPAGRFEATIRVDGQRHDTTLYGVTEDQDIHW